ncbi:MAG: OsmC family protein [Polyangiaceae bacterium]
MEIEIKFPGGRRVDARVGGRWISTDQPLEHGGEGGAPGPFDLFLASIATCAGFYVLAFCEARHIPLDGIRMRQLVEDDAGTKLPARIRIELELPPSFPASYRAAVVRAAEGCKVKRTLASMPRIEVTERSTSSAAAPPPSETTAAQLPRAS